MLERDIIIAIKIYLASLGSDVFFWKEHGGPYGTSGIPDIDRKSTRLNSSH